MTTHSGRGETSLTVLYVSHSGLISGAERALLDQLAVLPGSVHSVVATPPGPFAETLSARGIDVYLFAGLSGGLRLRPVHTLRFGRQVTVSGRQLARILALVRPDVIHANSVRAGLVAIAGNRLHQLPFVLHVHDVFPKSVAAWLIRHILRDRADAVITISRFAAQNFAGRASVRNIWTLYNPLDVEAFDPTTQDRADARARLDLPPDTPLLGMVAQITPWKGQDRAISALSLVHRRHPQTRLILVGEAKFVGRGVRYDNPAYLQQLGEQIAELGLGGEVEFWGERGDIPTIMRALDILLVPSSEEPFGRSAIEAMAMETAVIATDTGGPAEYIADGIDGILRPPHDTRAWAESINELLDQPAKRERLGKAASPKVRSLFARSEYTRKVLSVYQQVARSVPASALWRLTSQDATGVVTAPVLAGQKRLRIVVVEHAAEIGGGQRSLLELLRVLGREHEVLVACPEGPIARALTELDVSTLTIPESQLAFKLRLNSTPTQFLRMLRARRKLRSQLALILPDVVHANSLRAGLLTSGFRRFAPTVVHCRDLLPHGVLAWAVRTLVLTSNSTTIAVSRASAARLGGRQWSKRGISVIDNPVDTNRFDPDRWDTEEIRSDLELAGGPVIGMVAQITPWKGQDRAIKILHRLRRTHPSAQLVIVGETKFVSAATSYDNRRYERELHVAVKVSGLDGAVRFLGEREDVERIMAALDVVLVPSTEEPFGRSVIEALAMGVPVVATANGGPAEVIRPGIDGVLLPPDDLDSWVQAVTGMITRGRRMESREYVLERFGRARHAAEVLSVYDRVINRRSLDGSTPLP